MLFLLLAFPEHLFSCIETASFSPIFHSLPAVSIRIFLPLRNPLASFPSCIRNTPFPSDSPPGTHSLPSPHAFATLHFHLILPLRNPLASSPQTPTSPKRKKHRPQLTSSVIGDAFIYIKKLFSFSFISHNDMLRNVLRLLLSILAFLLGTCP